ALVFLAEVMGLLLAHLGVERGDDADNTHLPLAGSISKVDERVVGLSEFDAPQLVPDFDAVAGKRQRTAFEQDVVAITGGRTAVRHGVVFIEKRVASPTAAAGQDQCGKAGEKVSFPDQ